MALFRNNFKNSIYLFKLKITETLINFNLNEMLKTATTLVAKTFETE